MHVVLRAAKFNRAREIRALAGLVRKVEFLGAGTGGLVRDGHSGHIGFAFTPEIRVDLDAAKQLLTLIVQGQQAVVWLELSLQRDLAGLQVLALFDQADRKHGAEAALPAFVFTPDHSGVKRRLVGLSDITQFLGKDLATISGRAAGGDTFPVRDKGTGHG